MNFVNTGGQGCPLGFDRASQNQQLSGIQDGAIGNGIGGISHQGSMGCPVGAVNCHNGTNVNGSGNMQMMPNGGMPSMGMLRNVLGSFMNALQSVIGFVQQTGSFPSNQQQGLQALRQQITSLLQQLYIGGGGGGGGGTIGPIRPPTGPGQSHFDVDRGLKFRDLTADQRSQVGLNNRDRAILHLWGRQVITDGKQDGSIYSTVLGPDGTGKDWPNQEEVRLVLELKHMERSAGYRTDNGTALDHMFFGLYERLTGVDLASRYQGRQIHNSNGELEITNDLNQITRDTGLSHADQAILRLLGHDPLIDGEMNGSILKYSLGNDNALDSDENSDGNGIDGFTRQLLNHDIQDNGVIDGSALLNHGIAVMDKIYGRRF